MYTVCGWFSSPKIIIVWTTFLLMIQGDLVFCWPGLNWPQQQWHPWSYTLDMQTPSHKQPFHWGHYIDSTWPASAVDTIPPSRSHHNKAVRDLELYLYVKTQLRTHWKLKTEQHFKKIQPLRCSDWDLPRAIGEYHGCWTPPEHQQW